MAEDYSLAIFILCIKNLFNLSHSIQGENLG